MKEIVTGSCLIAIAVLMTMLFIAHISNLADYVDERKKLAAGIIGLSIFTVAVAFGFSGCGIFIRGVIR